MYLLSALALGFFGSLHCVGMCGPISLALSGGKSRIQFWQSRALYNLGRTLSYVMLGLLVGTFGHSFMLAGVQQGLSISLGVLWLALLLFLPDWENKLLKVSIFKKLIYQVKTRLSALLKKERLPFMFNAGIVNGFLPCGLVYLALSGALASTTIQDSLLFMAAFGLGTFPAMFAISLFARQRPKILAYIKPVLYGLSIAFALLLILRGMNLGLPYLSPDLVATDNVCQ